MRSKIKKIALISSFISCFLVFSCTPIKTSSRDERHQMELTLHEVQTNIDDLRHELNCFKTDFQIIEGKIGHQENEVEGIKSSQIAQTSSRMDALSEKMKKFEVKISDFEKKQQAECSDLEKFAIYAKDINASLLQFKNRISELESNLIVQSRRYDEVKRLKETLDAIASSLKINNDDVFSYKVKAGDSLEKIAKTNKTSVDQLKKINNLKQDLIVVGQEIKIPK